MPLSSLITRLQRARPRWTRSISFSRVDHVCLVVRNVNTSIGWYRSVLNMRHEFKDHPSFGSNPAFMRSGNACLALLPLHPQDTQIRYHNGAHVAFTVTKDEFNAARLKLPGLLEANKVEGSQDVDILEEDYGIQKSIFFKDPDDNILELTYWVDAPR